MGKKIIGCPVIIENPKYARNAYIFNLIFVMDSQTETIKYESVVKKLASYLKQIEVSNVTISGFSSPNTDVVINKGCLVTIKYMYIIVTIIYYLTYVLNKFIDQDFVNYKN